MSIHEERQFQASADVDVFDTWESMNLKPELLEAIKANGWTKPSPIQARAIVPISMGRSMLVQSQNGTGKTATFSIGALQRINMNSPKTELIVLSPTRELAEQSERTLKSLGANARACIGGSSYSDDIKAVQKGINCISGTPGRILQLINENKIDRSKIKVIVIDEADEMTKTNDPSFASSLGRQTHEILKIVKAKGLQIVIVTATVSDTVLELMTAFCRDALQLTVQKDELTLTGVKQYYVDVEEQFKLNTLIDLYQSIAIERAIIFCKTRDKCNWLQDEMVKEGFTVAVVHGQLSPDERRKITDEFRDGETRVLIATDIMARGFDVRSISLVINFDIPGECETYLHRIGRSGRWGREGIAITFVAGAPDRKKLKKIEEFYSTKIPKISFDLDLDALLGHNN